MKTFWLLTTEYPPFFGGGIGTYCAHTAKMLVANGISVTVFFYDASFTGLNISYDGTIRVIRFNRDSSGVSDFLGAPVSVSYEFATLIKEYLLREGAPDVIEAQDYNGIAYYVQQFKLLRISPFSDLKIVITCHAPSFICLSYNHVPVYKFPNYWIGELEKACIRSADLVVFPSEYLLEEIQKHISLKGVKYEILPNPVGQSSAPPVPASSSEKYIACFGKMAPLKGTFELLKAFKAIWDEGSLVPLHIIGGTDYFFHAESKSMKTIIEKKYASYIERNLLQLKGNREPAEAIAMLQNAEFVIVPSLFDNFPYTALETMQQNKLLLASVQGGQREFINHGTTGMLFDHTISGDLKLKILECLSLTESKKKAIALKGREYIREKFSAAVIADQKISLLSKLTNNTKHRKTFPFIRNIEQMTLPENGESRKGFLSIIIPYYNMGDYIDDCLSSLKKIDYYEHEIIIINDGSNEEKSVQKLKSIRREYPHIKIYNQDNQGLPATRNKGISLAAGEFIAFLDADDMVAPEYHSTIIRAMQSYENVHFGGSWLKYTGEGSGCWPTFNPEPPYLLVHNMINSSALVFKTNSLKHVGKNDPALCYGMEDWDTVISMTKHGLRGIAVPLPLFHYRVRVNSMSQAFTPAKQLHLQKVIAEKHADFYGVHAGEIFLLLNSNGPSFMFDNPTFETVNAGGPALVNGKLLNRIKTIVSKNKYIKKVAYKIYESLNN